MGLAPAILALGTVGLCAAAARRLRWLTRGGAAAAWGVGSAVLVFGGLRPAAALLAFFLTGTGLTRLGRAHKTQPEHRGGGRGAAQVLGTGGVAAAASLLWGLGPLPEPLRVLFPAAIAGSLAAAAADTWATEIGMLNRTPPRLITTGEPVPPGTSGGVTLLGSAAGAAGAALIAAVASVDPTTWIAATVAGVTAMLLDSLLGATVQAQFRNPDGTVGEEPLTGAWPVQGIAWITNPIVNLLATLAGALFAGALAALMRN